MPTIGQKVRQAFLAARRAVGKASSEIGYVRKFILPALLLSYHHGRRLGHVSGFPRRRPRTRIVAVVPYYGNQLLLPSFLRYYRRLGVGDFVFLDLSPQRRLAELLAQEGDCAVWLPRGSQSPRLAIHWLNFLRRRYCTGRWCLSVEPSEFFVFPRSESRDIRDLVEFLETEQRNHLFGLTLDMYGDREATEISFAVDDEPFEALPYFDPVGYTCRGLGPLRSAPTEGGVQRRTVFSKAPQLAPPLNRIPLVRWRWSFSYVAGTRLMTPGQLNTAHAPWHLTPTSCLLRCALLDDDLSMAIAERVEATILVRDQATAHYPALFEMRSLRLKHAGSVRYATSEDLVEWGLMTTGQWF